jgi:hypothetical protein
MTSKIVIFDIDGTLANLEHRLHFIRPEVGKTYQTKKSDIPYEVTAVDYKTKTVWLRGLPENPTTILPTNWKNLKFKPDWDAFHGNVDGDAPIQEMLDLCWMYLKMRSNFHNHPGVIFVTGRMRSCELATRLWLEKHLKYSAESFTLLMRPDSDYRPDFEIKEKILHELKAKGINPILAFDDRQTVVDMWRRNGVRCAQVAEGNF